MHQIAPSVQDSFITTYPVIYHMSLPVKQYYFNFIVDSIKSNEVASNKIVVYG